MKITEAIAHRMKELAYERKASLNEIIRRSGINQSTISEIVQGRSKHPRVSTIQKFCNGCGITMREFFNSEIFENIDSIEEKKEDIDEDNLFEFAAKIPPK